MDARGQQEAETDVALWRRLAHGRDARSFRLLLRRHLKRVHGVAWRILLDEQAAEDVAQEVFLKLWQRPEMFDPARGRLAAWLARTAANAAIDRLRRDSRAHLAADPPALEALPDARPGPEQALLAAERDRLLRAAMERLPPRQRQALALAHDAGLGNAEIAAVMETSVEAVESLLARARRALRKELRPLLNPGGEGRE